MKNMVWDLAYDPWIATSLIGLLTVYLIYRYSIKNHDYWKKRGIPCARTWPFLGSVFEMYNTLLHELEVKRYNELGLIYGHFEASKALLSVADTSLIRDILVKDFQVFTSRRTFDTNDKVLEGMLSVVQGEDWKRIRSIVSPTFSTGKIKRMLSIFKDCSRTTVNNFKTASEGGKPVDCKRFYGAFTMDIIASSAFSTKIDSHNDPDNQFVTNARKVFVQKFTWRLLLIFLAPKLIKYFGIFPSGTLDFFKDVTLQIVKERKKTGQVRNDFLQLLMETAKDVSEQEKLEIPDKEDIATNYGHEDINHQIFKNVTSKNLSMDELVGQCVIFFLAGYDTTASTLAFATYSLAINPEIQDKVREEIDDALKKTNGEMTYEAVQSMKYLDNVISETLRLYPPAIKTERRADVDYKLGDTGITVEKGTLVTIPIYALHRDPKHFPDPDRFDPDRFTVEEKAKRDQYAYLPFGAGPRNCVAMRFALNEIKVCLAHVISNFIIKRCPETKVPMEFFSGQGMLQPKEIMVELEKRPDCPLVE